MWRMQVNRLAMISATPSPDSRIAKLRLANRGRLWLTRLSFSSTPPGLPPRREHWLAKKGEQIGHAMRSPSGPCRPSQCELTCRAVGRALPRFFFPTTNGMERLRRELEGRLGSGGKQTHCRQGVHGGAAHSSSSTPDDRHTALVRGDTEDWKVLTCDSMRCAIEDRVTGPRTQ